MVRPSLCGMLLLLVVAPGALAQDGTASDASSELRYTVAVFLFANQTYDESLGTLEAGLRDIIAQTMALHPQVDVVDPLHTQDVECLRDVFGGPLLSGVCDEMQAHPPRLVEDRPEQGGRVAELRGVEAHTEQLRRQTRDGEQYGELSL